MTTASTYIELLGVWLVFEVANWNSCSFPVCIGRLWFAVELGKWKLMQESCNSYHSLSSLGIKIYIRIKLSRKCLQIFWCREVRVSGSCWDSNVKISGFLLTGGKWWPIEILTSCRLSLSTFNFLAKKKILIKTNFGSLHVILLNTHWASLSLSSPTTPENAHIWLPTECFILNGIFVCLSDILLLDSRQGGVTS